VDLSIPSPVAGLPAAATYPLIFALPPPVKGFILLARRITGDFFNKGKSSGLCNARNQVFTLLVEDEHK
jgi:hypothetical protein